MNRPLTDLFDEYDELAHDVALSSYETFTGNLSRWYRFLDGSAPFAGYVLQLESTGDYDGWLKRAEATMSSMMGSAKLDWPPEKEKRLGAQLLLFRSFAYGRMTVSTFGSMFMHRDGSLEVTTSEIIRRVFDPMVRELRRYMDQKANKEGHFSQPGPAASPVPAADRVVSLDHNSASYAEAVEAVDRLEALVRGGNEFDPEERERHLAELAAGKELLKPKTSRIAAVANVLGSAAKYLAKKFMDSAIGQAAKTTLEKLGALFGPDFWNFF